MNKNLTQKGCMRSVHIENPGPCSRLFIEHSPTPKYSESQVLVRVRATALNRADIMQRYGKYPPPPGESEILGLEIAGDIIAIGSKVSQFKPGDKIYGLVGSGAYAEICPVEASLAQHIPDQWDYVLAAALPEALTTAYATLFDLGNFQAGQNLLIHGAGSGISSFAIQMAKLAHGHVITTVGTEKKIEPAAKLGPDQIINYNEQDFEDLIEDHSLDLIIDFIGGNYFDRHLHLLKPKGKLIQIACLAGSRVECNLALIMRKQLKIIGFVLRTQRIEEKSKLWLDAHTMWLEHLKMKKLTPIIDSIFKIEQIEEAHQHMQSSAHFGKIIVLID